MSMTPTETFVKESRRMCEAATEGPWATDKPPRDADGWPMGVVVAAVARGQCVYANPPGGVSVESDRQFIAHARSALPQALDIIEQQAKRIEELEAENTNYWDLYQHQKKQIEGTDEE